MKEADSFLKERRRKMSQATLSSNQSNSLISDQDLVNAFYTSKQARFQYRALFVPFNADHNLVSHTEKYLWANSIKDAKKIADETGARIFGLRNIMVARA
jgi:hypothetical protein